MMEKLGEGGNKFAVIVGRTAVGLGVGVCLGIGALAAATIAEVVIPAVLTFQAFGLACGAVGFLSGARALKRKG